MSSFNSPNNISPIAFVNVYVLGHPYLLALTYIDIKKKIIIRKLILF